MPWRIIVSPRAERDLTSLPRADREAVRSAVDQMRTDLGLVDLRKLGGRSGEWRLRVGRWRLIVHMDNQAGEITISRVLPRDRAYRN